MRFFLSFFLFLYNVYASLLFIALMLPVFLFALPASFMGNIRGGNLIYRACMLWGDTWFFLIGIRHRNIHEAPIHKERPYIFVANHISYLDAPVIVKAIRRHVRALGKVEMAKVPVFGFIYRRAIVTVDRTSSANRTKSVQVLKSILRKNISVLVFPEGTFNQTNQPLKSFYDGAFRVAIETNTPVKPVLFLDAYNRMPPHRLLSLNPGRNRCIFLEEIAVDGMTVQDVQHLKKKVFEQMSQKLREYEASWIKE